jgi:hypothetical protein
VGFAVADTSLSEICSRYHAIAYNTFVVCSQSVVDRSINQKLGIDTIKPGGAWTAVIEAGSGRLMAGPLAPEEEGIVYADIDLQDAHTHYFLHETTGHYWPKQFQVHFDARELRPLWVHKGGTAAEAEGDEKTEGAERIVDLTTETRRSQRDATF